MVADPYLMCDRARGGESVPGHHDDADSQISQLLNQRRRIRAGRILQGNQTGHLHPLPVSVRHSQHAIALR